MQADVAIEVRNISKKFRVYLDKGSTMKEKVLFRNRRKYEERMVLDGISFSVKKGEAVGLIGHNGCGKSTTLKLLTRIMYPDMGSIVMYGRVSSLIELGAGFHPDMSGRQNIYTNASIFGLTHKEITARLDSIIAFSELEDFIDNPVRTYSSGMYMRLAFSVAINVDADILLIDEILAVGDAAFQAKCFNKLREIKAKGTTIVIVSHSLGQIEQICERSLWIHEGKIRAEGAPREIHLQYLDYMGEKMQQSLEKKKEEVPKEPIKTSPSNTPNSLLRGVSEGPEVGGSLEAGTPEREGKNRETASQEVRQRWGSGNVSIVNIQVMDASNEAKTVFATDEPIIIRVFYTVKKRVEDADFGIGIFRNDGLQCYGTNTRIEQFPMFNLEKDGSFELRLKAFSLLPGKYWLDLAVETVNGLPVDYYTKAVFLEIYSVVGDVGVCRVPHEWKLDL